MIYDTNHISVLGVTRNGGFQFSYDIKISQDRLIRSSPWTERDFWVRKMEIDSNFL